METASSSNRPDLVGFRTLRIAIVFASLTSPPQGGIRRQRDEPDLRLELQPGRVAGSDPDHAPRPRRQEGVGHLGTGRALDLAAGAARPDQGKARPRRDRDLPVPRPGEYPGLSGST